MGQRAFDNGIDHRTVAPAHLRRNVSAVPRFLPWNIEYGRRMRAFLALVLVLCSGAASVHPGHSRQVDPAFSAWIDDLLNPATGLSCDKFDPHVLGSADWRYEADHYQIRIAGRWREVPPPAVIDRIDNPTGSAVAFYVGAADHDGSVAPLVYCFVRPART